MSFQFGTNWPGYMERVGNIAGPLLGYEVLTAFFLEAGFLGVMLFGHGRVGERVHLDATFCVAFGTHAERVLDPRAQFLDADAGRLRDHRWPVYHARNWLEVIFNPSFPYRFAHMVLASALTCAFLLTGLQRLADPARASRRRSAPRVLRVGLTFAALLIPAADLRRRPARPQHARSTSRRRSPRWKASGKPSAARRCCCSRSRRREQATNHFELAMPKLASLILTARADGEIKGLNEFRDRPIRRSLPLFFAFPRSWSAMGVLMLLTSWIGLWLYRRAAGMPRGCRGRCCGCSPAMTFAGWVATVAGWYVTEIGRQPFIVARPDPHRATSPRRCRRR